MTLRPTRAAIRRLALMLALCAVPVPVFAQAPPAEPPLTLLVPEGQSVERRLPRAKRNRRVTARVEQFAAGRDRADQRVLLNLFDDVQVVAKRRNVLARGSDAFVWTGQIETESGAPAQGDVTLVVRNGVLVGTVFLPGRTFEIVYAGRDALHVQELDPAAFPTEDPDIQAPPDLEGIQLEAPAAAVSDASTQIDIMVVWTPSARSAAGGTSAIQSLIDLSVANANTTYANSQVNTSLRLVYAGEISYTETSDIGTDLGRLAGTADGYIDQVHTMRNTYGADIVSMIGNVSGACGIGYLLPSASSAYSGVGFNVVHYSCAAGNLSFAHEVGHNQGLHHDPPNASGSPAYPYAYGYQDPGGSFRTVMSYGSAPRVMRLSNPNLTYNGRVTGVPNSQDNARALNNTASAVANFRQATGGSCSYSVSPASGSFPADGGTLLVTISTTSGCDWNVTNLPGWITPSASSGTGSAMITLTAGANTGAERSASPSVAGKTVSLSQAAGASCSYTVSPSSASFPASGGSANVSITTGSSCGWTVSNGTGWVTTSAVSGTGSATVTLSAPVNSGSTRSGSLSVAGQNVSVSQTGASCSYAVSPTTASFPAGGGFVSVSVTTASSCSWSVSNGTWWVTPGTTSGSGTSTVVLSAPANTGAARSGSLTIAGQNVSLTQASASCSYTVSPTTASFASGGGSVNVSITTASSCSWSVSNGTGWVSTSAPAGTGSATVALSAPANTGGARSGTLSIAGQSVSVSQAAASCSYSVSPTSASFGSNGGAVNVSIATGSSCSWSVGNGTGWVSTSATSGTGPATVTLSAGANSGGARSGSLSIAGQSVSVSQAAAPVTSCTYSVSPGSVSFSKLGGSVVVSVETGDGCGWTVSSDVNWIAASAAAGSGPSSIALTATSNGDKQSRSGYVTIGGRSIAVKQSGGPAAPKKPRVR